MDKTILIFGERMAGWLMYNGCHKIMEKKDLKNKEKNIYIFKDNEIVRELMNKYVRI